MTRIPLKPWQRARRRRLIIRHAVLGVVGGTFAGICYQILVCFILK